MELTGKYSGAGRYSGDGTCRNSSTFKCTIVKWEITAHSESFSTRECQDSCRTVLSQGAIIAIVVFVIIAVLALTVLVVWYCRRNRDPASLPPTTGYHADLPPTYTLGYEASPYRSDSLSW
jgi:hypothetical protein